MTKFEPTKEFAISLDREDQLARFRTEFHIPKQSDGRDVIYLCGNSLGLQPKNVRAYLDEYLTDWATLGVEGHFHARLPWMSYHEVVAESLSKVVGCKSSEVITMNTLTVNLHLLMVSFYRPTKERYKILIECDAFPSDRYAVRSQVEHHGLDPDDAVIEVGKSGLVTAAEIQEVIEAEREHLALILMGGVNYLTGQFFDLKSITAAGHRAGAIVGFDLAHATGNVPLMLHDWDVDFAAWCSYKYLNAGPGGIGGAFVHERHHQERLSRFAGWWGHNKSSRFLMPDSFEPIATAEGWQLSNPAIATLAALRASLDLFDEAGMENLRRKSKELTNFLEYLLDNARIPGLSIITPSDPMQRGAQLSIRLSNGKQIFQQITSLGVIADWREPDVIRVAPVPLYNTFTELHEFVNILKKSTNAA